MTTPASATARLRPILLAAAIALLGGLVTACGSARTADDLFRAGHYEAALGQYQADADAGDPAACNRVGVHYYVGLGVPRDHEAAFAWFERGALAGNPDAQRNLGLMYLNGYGVETDVDLAFGWLDLAQRNGSRDVIPLLKRLPGKLTPNQMMRVRTRLKESLSARGLDARAAGASASATPGS